MTRTALLSLLRPLRALPRPFSTSGHAPLGTQFDWTDALRLNDQLTEEESMVRDTAHSYCQEKLMPRVTMANRNETTDLECFKGEGGRKYGTSSVRLKGLAFLERTNL